MLTYCTVALKDVVWLNTNEKVNVIARYAPWDGFYMFVTQIQILQISLTFPQVPLPQPDPRRSRDDGRLQRHGSD
jgi:hypothetical protein